MIYLITALLAEASPIIKHLKLNRLQDRPFKIFSSTDFKLIITGIGNEKATIATSHILTLFKPTENDYLFNIGICGAPDIFNIGDVLMINKISTKNRYFYPDMFLRHKFNETSLKTVNTPQDEAYNECIDMEASAIFSTSLYFLKSSQLCFIKIVSDHFSPKIPTKEFINGLITPHVESFEYLFCSAISMRQKNQVLSSEILKQSQQISENLRLSHSQKLQFHDALLFYVLSKGREPKLKNAARLENKLQRNGYFEQIITSLK